MNARFLNTFRLVAETGSLNAAARQLGLSSTSVSEQIKALERELRTPLVARHGRGLVLTEAGSAVLPVAREVLDRLEVLRHVAQLGQLRGTLRAGAISTAITGVLPAALRHMTQHCPGIDLRVHPGTATHLYERLERGELDCAIVGQPRFALPKTMVWHPIREEPLLLLCPSHVEGASIDAILTAGPLIRMDRNSWTGQIVSRFLDDRAIHTKELFEMDAPEALVLLVAQGIGVTLLPDWGIAEPAGAAIRRIPIQDRAYSRRIGVIGMRGACARLTEGFVAALRAGTAADC